MPHYVRAAACADVPEGMPCPVTVEGHAVLLFNLGGAYHATAEQCTHADFSLADGDIEGDRVVCPLHFASFCIKSGEVIDPPACEALRTFPVKVEDDAIWVKV